MKRREEVKAILEDITLKTMGELLSKFSFIMPHLYEAAFNKKVVERELDLPRHHIDQELRFLLDDIDEKGKHNEETLSKLVNYTDRAVKAIEKEDKCEIMLLKKETTNLAKHIQELEKKAYWDDITGLLNRNGFRREVCASNELKFSGSLFFIDLDHFKHINDTYGHGTGNKALRAFSNLLKKQLINIPLDRHFLSRAGGDEFLIAVDAKNASYAKLELIKMQKRSYKISINDTQSEALEFSMGFVEFEKGIEFERAVMLADKNMYFDKNNRRKEVA